MINTLYVNGCSWTSGVELEEDPKFKAYIKNLGWNRQDDSNNLNWNLIDDNNTVVSSVELHYDLFNWAGHLKNKLNIPTLVNHSIGAASNHRILRTTCEYIRKVPKEQYENLLVIIGWTASERNEIYVQNDHEGAWQRFNSTQRFSETYDNNVKIDQYKLNQLDKLQDLYTVHVNSDYSNIFEYFQATYLLSNLLEHLGIKYFFFNALPPWWVSGHLMSSCDPEVEFKLELEQHETNNNILHYGDSMYCFINHNNYPLATYKHPLSQGHIDWGDYLLSKLQERNIL